MAAFTDPVEVATQELNTTDLETFLDDLGGELIHAVLRGVTNDVVDCTTAVSWGTMFADVLNAPVAELTMSNNINAGKDFLNARALRCH